jgi:hypothetical protein
MALLAPFYVAAGMTLLAAQSIAPGNLYDSFREQTFMTKSSGNGIGRAGRGNGNGNGNVGHNNGNNNTGNNNGNNNVGANQGNNNSGNNNGNGSVGRSDAEDPIDLDVLTILRTLDIDFTGNPPAGGPRKRRLKLPGHDQTKH